MLELVPQAGNDNEITNVYFHLAGLRCIASQRQIANDQFYNFRFIKRATTSSYRCQREPKYIINCFAKLLGQIKSPFEALTRSDNGLADNLISRIETSAQSLAQL